MKPAWSSSVHLEYTLKEKVIELLEVYYYAVHKKNQSVVGITDGRSGLGKTTFTFQIAKYLDPTFSLAKVHYNPDTFLYGGDGKIGLKQAKQGDFIMFDEAMMISGRTALSKYNIAIVQAMSMIRSKNIFVWFCANSIFDLDKNLALFRTEILFHIYGKNLLDRSKVMAFFTGADGNEKIKYLYIMGKKYYDYAKPHSNFNVNFPAHFIFDQNEYDKQKDQGVNEFLTQLDKSKSSVASKHRDKLIMALREEGFQYKEISKMGGISEPTIAKIIKESELEKPKKT